MLTKMVTLTKSRRISAAFRQKVTKIMFFFFHSLTKKIFDFIKKKPHFKVANNFQLYKSEK